MAHNTTEQLAYRLWQSRNRPIGDPQRDLYRAELIEHQYANYLAYQAEHNAPDAIHVTKKLLPTAGVVLLAVLDGSTESMEDACERVFLASPYNGAVPKPELTAEKEREFNRICHNCWSEATYRGSQYNLSANEFPYRDACIAGFAGEQGEGLVLALASAVRLMEALADFNQTHSLNWQSQLHARVSVAETVTLTISNLYFAQRGELVLSPALVKLLSRSELRILRAIGLRSGASDEREANEGTHSSLVACLLKSADPE